MMEYFIRERGNAKKQKQIKIQPNKKYHIEITELKKKKRKKKKKRNNRTKNK